MDKLNVVWQGITNATNKLGGIDNPNIIITLTAYDSVKGKSVKRLVEPHQIKSDGVAVWVETESTTITVFEKAKFGGVVMGSSDPATIVMNCINSHFKVHKTHSLHSVIGGWF